MPTPATGPDLRNLLTRISVGDETAFRTLYEHYWNKIYSLAMHYFKSPTVAQDMVQEAFLKVWTRRAELTKIEQFDAFFFILARNLMLNELRKALPRTVDANSPGLALPERGLGPDQQLSARETATLIRRAIDSLPPRQQQVYRMSRDQGMKQEAIARELGISYNTVREHMSKALTGIRDFLRQHLDEFGLAILLCILS